MRHVLFGFKEGIVSNSFTRNAVFKFISLKNIKLQDKTNNKSLLDNTTVQVERERERERGNNNNNCKYF